MQSVHSTVGWAVCFYVSLLGREGISTNNKDPHQCYKKHQIHRNYLFVLEPNYFCFCDKFFYKLVFDPIFLEYSILCVLRWNIPIYVFSVDLSKNKEVCILLAIDLVSRVFANGPRDLLQSR